MKQPNRRDFILKLDSYYDETIQTRTFLEDHTLKDTVTLIEMTSYYYRHQLQVIEIVSSLILVAQLILLKIEILYLVFNTSMHTKYPLRYVTLTPIDNALKTESSTVLIVKSTSSFRQYHSRVSVATLECHFAKKNQIVTGPPS